MLSPGLRLYRALSGVPTGGARSIAGSRPAGRLVWLHAPDPAAAVGFAPLRAGLLDMGLADHVLITCSEPGLEGATEPPAEDPALAAAFLDHWRPDLCIWAAGDLRPVLIYAAAARSLPMILVDAADPGLQGRRFLPRLLGGLFAPFRAIFPATEAGAKAFQRIGAPARLMRAPGRMEEASLTLPVLEAERLELSKILGTRPVWLAVGVPEAEEETVLQAHERALRTTHRLLLILVPADPARIPELLRDLPARYGLEAGYRAADEDPDEETQVYLADDDEPGLWYRLSPVTWAGGTLSGPGPQRHPYEAAAAGSALMHGPRGGAWQPAFDRLREAGGARLIPNAQALGEAVGDLLAPDRCARMANAAWAVTSAGGETTAAVLDLADEILQQKGETP